MDTNYAACNTAKKVIKMPTVKEDSPQEVEETNNSKW